MCRCCVSAIFSARPKWSSALDKPAPHQTHTARRINRLAAVGNAKSYLEIGVQRGATFLDVRIPRKVGVDPVFAFPTAAHAKPGVEFHAMTSDAYFSHLPVKERFDLMFIDGLHTFEQTFRDFCNSLVHGHARTIWIIDDTVPIDIYSAQKIQAEALALRKQERRAESFAWHGDVYKVIFALHDFFPAFSYCTIATGGNPQTFAWMEKTSRTPKFNDLERISRMDYFEFTRHIDLMNPMSEADGLARVERFLRSVPPDSSGGLA